METTAQVIDWLGRASLVHSVSKPLLKKMLRTLRRPTKLGFWNGDTSTLVLLISNEHPAIIRFSNPATLFSIGGFFGLTLVLA